MDFNFSSVKSVLSTVLSAASTLSPMAGMLGIGKNIIDLVATGSEIGKNVMARIEDGTVVAKSEDKEELKALIAKLEAENAELDKYIRNS